MNQGTVTECNVVDCTYNQSQQCTSGAIDVSLLDASVQCYTYTKEQVSSDEVSMGTGAVSQCDVIDCTHNLAQRCIAAEIVVSLLDDLPQCVTYTTKETTA